MPENDEKNTKKEKIVTSELYENVVTLKFAGLRRYPITTLFWKRKCAEDIGLSRGPHKKIQLLVAQILYKLLLFCCCVRST